MLKVAGLDFILFTLIKHKQQVICYNLCNYHFILNHCVESKLFPIIFFKVFAKLNKYFWHNN